MEIMEIIKDKERKPIPEISKNKINNILKEIQNNNEVNPLHIYELYQILEEIEQNCEKTSIISDLFTEDIIYFFRTLILQEKFVRNIIIKIIRLNIQIYPFFTSKLLKSLYPIVICKIFEEYKKSTFEERYECFKLIYAWLKYSNNNFPLIFCQAIASLSRVDDLFKKGCIEFIRNLCVIRPDLCSTIGGFRILINNLIDINYNYEDVSDNILYSILYVINSPKKENILMVLMIYIKYFLFFQKVIFVIICTQMISQVVEIILMINKQLKKKKKKIN